MSSTKKGGYDNPAMYRAEELYKKVGTTREGRDRLTRVQKAPVRGIINQARQWNRYSP